MELSLPLLRRSKIEAVFRRPPPRRRVTARPGAHAQPLLLRPIAWLAGNRLALRAVLCALLAIPLLGGGWLWLRDSSLVAVRHVHIAGVQGVDGVEIRTALDDAATRMTTLDFNAAALRSAVAQFAIVAGLRVSTGFPHTVRISVSERSPVAALLSAGQRTAVAADGTVLGPALLSSSLPTIDGPLEPAPGAHLDQPSALAALAVLGAAPPVLARFVTRVYSGPEGLTVAMRNGLLVYFGDATRPHAKWLSLARVLVSPSAAGALYVDVRLPERPAAGFSSTPADSTSASASGSASASASTSTSAPVQAGASDPTAASLAASLEAAVGGGVSTGSAAPSETAGSTPSEAAGSTPGQAAGSAPTEASGSSASGTPAAPTTEASGASGSQTSETTTG